MKYTALWNTGPWVAYTASWYNEGFAEKEITELKLYGSVGIYLRNGERFHRESTARTKNMKIKVHDMIICELSKVGSK